MVRYLLVERSVVAEVILNEAKTVRLAVPAAPPFGVLQAVAFALGLQDVAAVREPIEGRPGQPLAAQHLGPVLERQVGGHDQAVPLVGRGDHVEQQFRPGLAGRHVAQLVEDQAGPACQVAAAAARVDALPWPPAAA